MRLLLLPAAALLALPLGAASPQKSDIPEATPAGPPVSCLSMTQIRSTRVRSDQVIDFVMKNGKVYRNELPHRCPRLGFEKRFLHRTTLNQYCSVDTITVLESPGISQGASCGLGEFQPVTLAKKN